MTDQLLLDTAAQLFRDKCTPQVIQSAEIVGWAPDLWTALAGLGFPWLSVPESAGGSGGSLADALAVLRVAGRFAVPLPLAETSVLAGWLLAEAGLPLGRSPLTVVPGRPEDSLRLTGTKLYGTAHAVPWAQQAERVVLLLETDDGWVVATVNPADAHVEPRKNLAGEPRPTLTFDGVEVHALVPAAPGVTADALLCRGALTRAMLMAGALERMSEMTVQYTNDRKQFGRPVATFQAVQIHLVNGAEDSALVNMAAETAARSAETGPATFEIAAAKTLASQASQSATRAAHQAHGAMGMTHEYPLHQLSRRLWSWRTEYGDERYWSTRLGQALAKVGADALYPAITGGATVLQV